MHNAREAIMTVVKSVALLLVVLIIVKGIGL
jgi:hypothetical protein